MGNSNIVPTEEVQKLMAATHIFLDVRSSGEIEAEKLPRDFVHCPCSRDDASQLRERASEILPDKNATILTFCRSGARSAMAKKELDSMGYSNVHNVGYISNIPL